MSSMFELTQQQEKLDEQIHELLLESGGEVTEAVEQLMQQSEAVGDSVAEKAENIHALILKLEAQEAFRKKQAARYAALAKSDKSAQDGLKSYMFHCMKSAGMRKIETPHGGFSIAKNGGRAPLVFTHGVVADELPEEFQKVRIDINTDAIREALENGEELEFARLGERGESLRIR